MALYNCNIKNKNYFKTKKVKNYFIGVCMKEYYTQMQAAKKGIITPEMKVVAEKERLSPQFIIKKLLVGKLQYLAILITKVYLPRA